MQFEIQLDPAKASIVSVLEDATGTLSEEMYQLNAETNSIRVSFVKGEHTENDWVIKLRIRATANCKLSDIVEMNANAFNSEVYYTNGESAPLRVDFINQYSGQEGISLFQNIPNPFKQSTIIPFQISERSDIEMRIVDINGKLIYETRASYNKGYHEIEIQKNQLDRSGIYYYQLKSNKYNLFRRMILID